MKILVYGAGVIGSYLAHVLVRGGNEVTILARGKRLKMLEKKGLVIRHFVQCKTTADYLQISSELKPEDKYDIIFVVMQYTHLHAVLPVLAENKSKNIIFVGNNADGSAVQSYMEKNSTVHKNIAFGFQSTGGRMEGSKVICIRMQGHMELGALSGKLKWSRLIKEAFSKTKYKLTFYDNMDAWHKSHIAMILPLCFAAYACDGDLRKASKDKRLLNQIINAIDEGYKVLETLDYPIIPSNELEFVREKRHLFYIMLKVVTRTPIGRLAISDHALAAVKEMSALCNAFDELKQQAGIQTPNWDRLEQEMLK